MGDGVRNGRRAASSAFQIVAVAGLRG
jgi:hypothetical protein